MSFTLERGDSVFDLIMQIVGAILMVLMTAVPFVVI